MNAIGGILSEIINTLLGLYALIVLLRFVFQLVKADFYNPISQGIVKMTSPVLMPLRRLVPGFWGLDIAALLLIVIIHFIAINISLLLAGINPLDSAGVIVIRSLLKFITGFINVFSFCLLVSIVLSFVAPMSRHPAAILVFQIAEPMMAPFRKIIPPFGGIDISPIFVFMALKIVIMAIRAFGELFAIPVQSMMGLFVFA